MKNVLLPLSLGLLFCACQSQPSATETAAGASPASATGPTTALSVEILDPEGRNVISPDAEIEVLAGGFTWTEGPLWIEDGEYLLFSDIPNNRVYKLTAAGDTSVYLYPSGKSGPVGDNPEPGSNGLLLDPEGRLVLMQHGDRVVARMNAPLANPKEAYLPVAVSYGGRHLNSPNDGTFDAAGNLYFTDPPYGLPEKMRDPGKELSFQGVYFQPAEGGALRLLDSLSYPNGIGLSPDGKQLYVAVSDPKHAVWYQYDVSEPGAVVNKRIFHDLTHLVGQKDQRGLPDGLKVNAEGYVFATGPGGVWIFNPDGKPLARIRTGQATANCALAYGGKRLFITADDYIMAVNLK